MATILARRDRQRLMIPISIMNRPNRKHHHRHYPRNQKSFRWNHRIGDNLRNQPIHRLAKYKLLIIQYRQLHDAIWTWTISIRIVTMCIWISQQAASFKLVMDLGLGVMWKKMCFSSFCKLYLPNSIKELTFKGDAMQELQKLVLKNLHVWKGSCCFCKKRKLDNEAVTLWVMKLLDRYLWNFLYSVYKM